MPIIDSILNEIDFELPTTLRVLERVPQEHLQWTPHAKSMSLGKLAWHIAGLPARIQVMLREGDFDVTTARPAEVPDQPGAIPAALRRNMDDLRAYIATLSDEALKERFTMRAGPKVLQQIPKIGVIRTILMNHTYHHRGQLAVYLRLLDVPVPAIYGNSADDNPFAR